MPKKKIEAEVTTDDIELEADATTSEELESELEQTQEQTVQEDEIPEKFKNKSVSDIIKSYNELESAFGRQSKEIGDYRKWSQEQLRRDLEAKNKPSKEDEEFNLTEDDFIKDPVSATTKLVDKRLERIEKALLATNSNQAQERFVNRHPDHAEIVASPEFAEWVVKTPHRINLFERADSFDFGAAEELMVSFKEYSSNLKALGDDAARTSKDANKSKMKKMAGESEAGSATSKKIYSSAKLIEIKMNDPDKYEAMMPEIMKAYQEGRVR